MSEVALCRIVFSSVLPPDEIEALSTLIRLTSAQVQKPASRAFGADDVALLITIAVGIGQLTEYCIKIAQAITHWREKARQRGVEVKGKLERPERPTLDLGTATEEEIKAWLLR
ncbi:MAG: hypothetical protein AAFY17_13385 [Cyanobacteria bacterium J06642_11]